MKFIRFLFVTLAMCGAGSAFAEDKKEKEPSICEKCSIVECPCCKKFCECEVVEEKVEKHCWGVKCEPICIPRIKFPWQHCCDPPRCAKVRFVNVLEKHTYECKHCAYKWTPVCKPPCRCESCCDK